MLERLSYPSGEKNYLDLAFVYLAGLSIKSQVTYTFTCSLGTLCLKGL